MVDYDYLDSRKGIVFWKLIELELLAIDIERDTMNTVNYQRAMDDKSLAYSEDAYLLLLERLDTLREKITLYDDGLLGEE